MDLLPQSRHAQPFAGTYLPSRLDVILHDAHLAEAGDVVSAYVDTRAELIAAHLKTIWVICDVLPADKSVVKGKLLKQSRDYQTKKLEIPNGAHLFDIALCRCFPFGTSKTTFVTSECKCGAEMTKGSATSSQLDRQRDPYCTIKFESVSAVASRKQMSHGDAALLATATYEDLFSFVTPETTVHPLKVMRSRRDYGEVRRTVRLAGAKRMRAVSFDERKDLTAVSRKVFTTIVSNDPDDQEDNTAEAIVKRTEREEHCVVIFYTPETYIETIRLGKDEGTGKALAGKIHKVMKRQDCLDGNR